MCMTTKIMMAINTLRYLILKLKISEGKTIISEIGLGLPIPCLLLIAVVFHGLLINSHLACDTLFETETEIQCIHFS